LFLHTLPQQIWFAVICLTSGFAFLRGGWPERVVAAIYLAAWFVSRLVYDYKDWVDPQWSVLAVDGGLLLALVIMSLLANRTWLLFAAAFQLVAVVVHVAIMADPSIRALPYVRGLVIWSYLTQAALLVGVLDHLRHRRAQAVVVSAPARR
jgi:hypothetical protein